MKQCTKCRKRKELKDFPSGFRFKEGEAYTYFHKLCKKCTSVSNKARRSHLANKRKAAKIDGKHTGINPYFLVRGKVSTLNKGDSIIQDTNVT